MVVGSPICVYAFYAVSDFLKEKVTMYEEWKKAQEQFQECEVSFQNQLEEIEKFMPMIEVVSLTVPVLIQAYKINLERFQESIFTKRKILKKIQESKNLEPEEHAQIVCFLAERQKMEDLKALLKQEWTKAKQRIQCTA